MNSLYELIDFEFFQAIRRVKAITGNETTQHQMSKLPLGKNHANFPRRLIIPPLLFITLRHLRSKGFWLIIVTLGGDFSVHRSFKSFPSWRMFQGIARRTRQHFPSQSDFLLWSWPSYYQVSLLRVPVVIFLTADSRIEPFLRILAIRNE